MLCDLLYLPAQGPLYSSHVANQPFIESNYFLMFFDLPQSIKQISMKSEL